MLQVQTDTDLVTTARRIGCADTGEATAMSWRGIRYGLCIVAVMVAIALVVL